MSVFITFLVIERVRLRVTKKVKYEDNNNNMEIKKDKRIVLNGLFIENSTLLYLVVQCNVKTDEWGWLQLGFEPVNL